MSAAISKNLVHGLQANLETYMRPLERKMGFQDQQQKYNLSSSNQYVYQRKT